MGDFLDGDSFSTKQEPSHSSGDDSNNFTNTSSGGDYNKQGGGFDKQNFAVDLIIPKSIAILTAGAMDESSAEKLSAAARAFADRGFRVRGSGQDASHNLLTTCGLGESYEAYIPWKGYKLDRGKGAELVSKYLVTDSIISIAELIDKYLKDNKPAMKKIFGNKYAPIIGKRGYGKTDLLMLWSQDGAESYRDCSDDSKDIKGALFMAESLGITIVNMKNESANEKLKAFVGRFLLPKT